MPTVVAAAEACSPSSSSCSIAGYVSPWDFSIQELLSFGLSRHPKFFADGKLRPFSQAASSETSPFSSKITFNRHCTIQITGISRNEPDLLDFLRKASASISSKELVRQGDDDIFFPTDFWLLERIDHHCSGYTKETMGSTSSKPVKKRRKITMFQFLFLALMLPPVWRNLGCHQKQRLKMATIPFLMISRRLNFTRLCQHTMHSRYMAPVVSIDGKQRADSKMASSISS